MPANDRIAARASRAGSAMWAADGPLKAVSRLDEHLSERFAEGDSSIGEGFQFYEQLAELMVQPEQREWVLEEIRQQHDFARREYRRLSVAVEFDVDGASVGATMTHNLVNVMRVHRRLQRLVRSAHSAMYRILHESKGDEIVGLHRAAILERRAQVRKQTTKVLQAIALFHVVRIVIFGVVTAATAQLIDNAFPASLGWWGLIAGSAVGYSVTRYLIVPVLNQRLAGLMLRTTLALLDGIVNVCRSNAATYVMLARTLGDIVSLEAVDLSGNEPTGDSPS